MKDIFLYIDEVFALQIYLTKFKREYQKCFQKR